MTDVLTPRKRAYRYEVIETWGSGTKAIGDSPNILDWRYYGKEYTWTICGGPRFEVEGTITGRYLDRGYCEDGTYKSDAELKALTPATLSPPVVASDSPASGGAS